MNNDLQGNVLVVEDQDLERETLIALLRRTGHTAWGAADADAALEMLETKGDSIDVVLCDLRLKNSAHTGVDLLRQWKIRQPSTPFVFVTGVFEIAQVVEAVKLGAEDYLTKPYNTAELLRRVDECIEASQETSPSHAGDPDSDLFSGDFQLPSDLTVEELNRLAIEGALRRFNGNRTRAANALGISVRTLQRKLKAWAEPSATPTADLHHTMS